MGKIAYRLTIKESVDVLRRHRSFPITYLLPIGLIFMGILPLVFASKGRQEGLYQESYYVIGIGVLLLTYPLFIRRSILTKAVRNTAILTEPTEAVFDDQGIAFALPNRRSQVTWAVFVKLTQDANYFYLHTNKAGGVLPLPRRAFDAASIEEFERCTRLVPRE